MSISLGMVRSVELFLMKNIRCFLPETKCPDKLLLPADL